MTRKSLHMRGFTLIELLVVIAIIGILSSVVLASLNTARKKGRDARRIADIKQVQLALELYYDSYNKYPEGNVYATALSTLTTSGFISVLPVDPTNSGSYVYAYQSTDGAVTPAVCSSPTVCTGYILKTVLETAGHTALAADIDGTQAGVACGTQGSSEVEFCVKP